MTLRRAGMIVAVSAALACAPYMRDAKAFGDAPLVIAAIEALQAALGQLMSSLLGANLANVGGTLELETSRQISAQRLLAQGRIAAESHLFMEQARAEAIERTQAAAMQDVSLVNGVLLGEQTQVMATSAHRRDAAAVAAMRSDRWDPAGLAKRHAAQYCTGNDRRQGRCASPVSSTLQGAEVSIDTVLNPGQGQYETLADADAAAATLFVGAVVAPRPQGFVAVTGHAGRVVEGTALADQAALSIASHALSRMASRRVRREGGQ